MCWISEVVCFRGVYDVGIEGCAAVVGALASSGSWERVAGADRPAESTEPRDIPRVSHRNTQMPLESSTRFKTCDTPYYYNDVYIYRCDIGSPPAARSLDAPRKHRCPQPLDLVEERSGWLWERCCKPYTKLYDMIHARCYHAAHPGQGRENDTEQKAVSHSTSSQPNAAPTFQDNAFPSQRQIIPSQRYSTSANQLVRPSAPLLQQKRSGLRYTGQRGGPHSPSQDASSPRALTTFSAAGPPLSLPFFLSSSPHPQS